MDSKKYPGYVESLNNGELLIEATKSSGKYRLFKILQALINFLGKDATVDEGSAILEYLGNKKK